MKNIIITLLALILFIFSTSIGYAQEYIIISGTARWCGPCAAMKAVWKSEPIVKYLKDSSNVQFYALDIDQEAQVAQNWGISVVPTIIIAQQVVGEKRWKPLYRTTGYRNASVLLTIFQKYIKNPVKKVLTLPENRPIHKNSPILLWKTDFL
jgi:thiol-disulfide isomerase/thioredoxin